MSSKYNDLPKPIPDTPENIARACMQGPPKKQWDYLKKEAEPESGKSTPKGD